MEECDPVAQGAPGPLRSGGRMKRWIAVLALAACGAHIVTVPAEAKRGAVRPAAPRRTVVVVSPGWPLKRSLRAIVVHPVRTTIQATSTTFFTPVPFTGTAIAAASGPTRDMI